jgi:hypothetical protein
MASPTGRWRTTGGRCWARDITVTSSGDPGSHGGGGGSGGLGQTSGFCFFIFHVVRIYRGSGAFDPTLSGEPSPPSGLLCS